MRDTTHFGADCYQYNSITGSRNVLMKMTIIFPTNAPRFNYFRTGINVNRILLVSGFLQCIKNDIIYIEATDIDFINTLGTDHSKQGGFSSNSNISSDIDLIAEEIESTTSRASKRFRNLTSKSSKQDDDLTFAMKEEPVSDTEPTQNKRGKETFKPNIKGNMEKEKNFEEKESSNFEILEELDNQNLEQKRKANTKEKPPYETKHTKIKKGKETFTEKESSDEDEEKELSDEDEILEELDN
ncbi:297_t:CDS:1 [Dentiscutata erythropus]|uniref:297_t:CDS:1 n=1 Tax=Dentiscutata erythropus TaxID=1348616 RepID=A0A9N9P7C5_9GLOM|nr:297_t:CDS:1 [Dentiscutata erythropus]